MQKVERKSISQWKGMSQVQEPIHVRISWIHVVSEAEKCCVYALRKCYEEFLDVFLIRWICFKHLKATLSMRRTKPPRSRAFSRFHLACASFCSSRSLSRLAKLDFGLLSKTGSSWSESFSFCPSAPPRSLKLTMLDPLEARATGVFEVHDASHEAKTSARKDTIAVIPTLLLGTLQSVSFVSSPPPSCIVLVFCLSSHSDYQPLRPFHCHGPTTLSNNRISLGLVRGFGLQNKFLYRQKFVLLPPNLPDVFGAS